jgi:hypothetical protein
MAKQRKERKPPPDIPLYCDGCGHTVPYPGMERLKPIGLKRNWYCPVCKKLMDFRSRDED